MTTFEGSRAVVTVHACDLQQIAQAVHQAYHGEDAGTWRTCGKLTCSRIAAMLEQPRYIPSAAPLRGPYGYQESATAPVEARDA